MASLTVKPVGSPVGHSAVPPIQIDKEPCDLTDRELVQPGVDTWHVLGLCILIMGKCTFC